MQSQLVLYILGALAFSGVAEEALCTAAGDTDDDRCTLLQGNVGVSSIHKGAEQQGQHEAKVIVHAKEHHAESSVGTKAVSEGASAHAKEHAEGSDHTKGDAKNWPDIFKTIKAGFSGAFQLETDFDAVTDAVATFEHEVHGAETALLHEFDKSKSLDFNLGKAEHFYNNVHDAAVKFSKALKKVSEAWVNGVGKVVPHEFKSVLTGVLTTANDQAQSLAASFKTAADSLKSAQEPTNTSSVCYVRGIRYPCVCAQIKDGLHTVVFKASELAKSVTGLSTKGFSKDLKTARDALPESLQKEINKVLKKANDAADHILSKLTPAMHEITHGVTITFEHQCPNLHSGVGQLKAGLFLGSVLSVLAFSM